MFNMFIMFNMFNMFNMLNVFNVCNVFNVYIQSICFTIQVSEYQNETFLCIQYIQQTFNMQIINMYCTMFCNISMCIQCTFNVYSMQCLFNVYSMCIQCVFNVYSMYIQCTFNVYSMFNNTPNIWLMQSYLLTYSHTQMLHISVYMK